MRKMKDSGVEWVGEVPEEWKIGRIGGLYFLRNEKVSDADYQPLSVTNKGIVPQLETAAKTNAHDDRKLVKIGDFVINSRSDRRGSCGISAYEGSVSLINTVLAPRNEMDPEYYKWVFHTSQFADEFYKWGHGIVDDLWTTRWQDMKKILIPVPDIYEQYRIASFLNFKCSEIDALSANIQSQIDTLEGYKKSIITEAVTKGLDPDAEMRDSGVEWIGSIPKHWQLSKIKYVSEFSPICKKVPNNEHIHVGYSPMESIKNGYHLQKDIELIDLPKSLTPYEDGDIVMAKVTPCFENGNIAIMSGTPSGIGFGSSELFVFRALYIETKYLFYWLRGKGFMNAATATMNGANGLKRVSSHFVKNSKICVPPIYEQNKIIEFLNCKCSEVDYSISSLKRSIETLVEYKKSLVYEYVTGKKEVTGSVRDDTLSGNEKEIPA